jgi:cbb3-type cytochrome oxidase subunit 1
MKDGCVMRGISFWFVFSASVYVLFGMAWGIEMSISGDHGLAPAHAHLNLIGWVTMALFGYYYHLVPRAGEAGLAKVHFAIATLGLWCIVPGIVLAIQQISEVLAKTGSMLTILSMLIFVVTVFRHRDNG